MSFNYVQNFAKQRRGNSFPDSTINILINDAFWERKEGVFSLRPAVVKMFQILKKSVLKQENQSFKNVLGLIRQMLDINPRTRIVALILRNELERIYRRNRNDLSVIDDNAVTRPADLS